MRGRGHSLSPPQSGCQIARTKGRPGPISVPARIFTTANIVHTRDMNGLLFLCATFLGIVSLGGLIVLLVASRTAPEGFESEADGFVGLTKGDEMLLNEFASQRAALLNAGIQASV